MRRFRVRARLLSEDPIPLGHLDAERRAGVEGIVSLQLKKHGGAEKGLATIPALLPGECAVRYSIGSPASGGQRFRVLRPHA